MQHGQMEDRTTDYPEAYRENDGVIPTIKNIRKLDGSVSQILNESLLS